MGYEIEAIIEPGFENLAGYAVSADEGAYENIGIQDDAHWRQRLPGLIAPELNAHCRAGFVDQPLDLVSRQLGGAISNLPDRGAQYLLLHRALYEFRQVAFLAAMLGEIGSDGDISFLADLDRPARQIDMGAYPYKRLCA